MTTSAGPRYDDLSALFFNCTLKPSPQLSHTQGLIDLSAGIMRKHGVQVETIRAAALRRRGPVLTSRPRRPAAKVPGCGRAEARAGAGSWRWAWWVVARCGNMCAGAWP